MTSLPDLVRERWNLLSLLDLMELMDDFNLEDIWDIALKLDKLAKSLDQLPILTIAELRLLELFCFRFGLDVSRDIAKEMGDLIDGAIDEDSLTELAKFQIQKLTYPLHVAFKKEMKRTVCFYLPRATAAYMSNPYEGWDAVIKRWPDAAYDIEEASKCLALSRSTAVVYHLGRIAEQGLRDACTMFIPAPNLPQPPKMMMGNYLACIEDFYDKNPKHIGKLELTEAATFFRPIKNVWRDNVSHVGTKYTEDEASRIYDAIQNMLTACAKIV